MMWLSSVFLSHQPGARNWDQANSVGDKKEFIKWAETSTSIGGIALFLLYPLSWCRASVSFILFILSSTCGCRMMLAGKENAFA